MVHLNIEYLLEKKKKSRYWLVTELHSNYTVVNKMIDNETESISYKTIEKLIEVFDCDFNELFIKSDEKKK